MRRKKTEINISDSAKGGVVHSECGKLPDSTARRIGLPHRFQSVGTGRFSGVRHPIPRVGREHRMYVGEQGILDSGRHGRKIKIWDGDSRGATGLSD